MSALQGTLFVRVKSEAFTAWKERFVVLTTDGKLAMYESKPTNPAKAAPCTLNVVRARLEFEKSAAQLEAMADVKKKDLRFDVTVPGSDVEGSAEGLVRDAAGDVSIALATATLAARSEWAKAFAEAGLYPEAAAAPTKRPVAATAATAGAGAGVAAPSVPAASAVASAPSVVVPAATPTAAATPAAEPVRASRPPAPVPVPAVAAPAPVSPVSPVPTRATPNNLTASNFTFALSPTPQPVTAATAVTAPAAPTPAAAPAAPAAAPAPAPVPAPAPAANPVAQTAAPASKPLRVLPTVPQPQQRPALPQQPQQPQQQQQQQQSQGKKNGATPAQIDHDTLATAALASQQPPSGGSPVVDLALSLEYSKMRHQLDLKRQRENRQSGVPRGRRRRTQQQQQQQQPAPAPADASLSIDRSRASTEHSGVYRIVRPATLPDGSLDVRKPRAYWKEAVVASRPRRREPEAAPLLMTDEEKAARRYGRHVVAIGGAAVTVVAVDLTAAEPTARRRRRGRVAVADGPVDEETAWRYFEPSGAAAAAAAGAKAAGGSYSSKFQSQKAEAFRAAQANNRSVRSTGGYAAPATLPGSAAKEEAVAARLRRERQLRKQIAREVADESASGDSDRSDSTARLSGPVAVTVTASTPAATAPAVTVTAPATAPAATETLARPSIAPRGQSDTQVGSAPAFAAPVAPRVQSETLVGGPAPGSLPPPVATNTSLHLVPVQSTPVTPVLPAAATAAAPAPAAAAPAAAPAAAAPVARLNLWSVDAEGDGFKAVEDLYSAIRSDANDLLAALNARKDAPPPAASPNALPAGPVLASTAPLSVASTSAAPAAAASNPSTPTVGFTVSDNRAGVVRVMKIEPGSAAALAGISKDEVLVSINEERISSMATFRAAFAKHCSTPGAVVRVGVRLGMPGLDPVRVVLMQLGASPARSAPSQTLPKYGSTPQPGSAEALKVALPPRKAADSRDKGKGKAKAKAPAIYSDDYDSGSGSRGSDWSGSGSGEWRSSQSGSGSDSRSSSGSRSRSRSPRREYSPTHTYTYSEDSDVSK